MSTPWHPGEHVAVIGQTGRGKTHVIDRLVRENRAYVIVFKTKDDPEDADKYWRGFKRIETVSGLTDTRFTRFLLAPPLGKYPQQYDHMIREGHRLIAKVFKQGGWTVVFDERWLAENILGLQSGIEMLETQGRSKGISVVSGMQRPVDVSRQALAQATHIVSFAGDTRDGDTIGKATTKPYGQAVMALKEHDFAYYHRVSGRIMRGNSQGLSAVIRPALAGVDSVATAVRATMRAAGTGGR